MDITFKELLSVSGVSESDARTVFSTLGADLLEVGTLTLSSTPDALVPPGRATAVLLYRWMTTSGIARDRILLTLQFLKGYIEKAEKLLNQLSSSEAAGSIPDLYLVCIYDDEWVVQEKGSLAFNLLESRTAQSTDLEWPVTGRTFSIVMAYLRTAATIRSRRRAREVAGSDGTSPTFSL